MIFNDEFFSEIGKSAPVVALITNVANEVAAIARASAEVDTGDYRNSIHVETKEAEYRTVALVIAADDKSMIIEARTGNLARAIRAKHGQARRAK